MRKSKGNRKDKSNRVINKIAIYVDKYFYVYKA